MNRPRFLVIGEALVDVITRAGRPIDEAPQRVPGGSPTNVAVGLGRLGHHVTELTSIGPDTDGDLLRSYLADGGVELHADSILSTSTSVAFASLGADGDASYAFSIAWDCPPTIDWTDIDVVHAGSIALTLEPGASHVLDVLRSRPGHVRVSIDPNIRPDFVPRELAAELLEPYFALADLVKLSHEDAAYLYPDHTDLDQTLHHLLALGPQIVTITLGSRGAVAATPSDRVWAPATAPHLVDTVGAGDSFTAGLLDAISSADDGWTPDRETLRAIVEHASNASAITVARAGADLPWRRELPLPFHGSYPWGPDDTEVDRQHDQ